MSLTTLMGVCSARCLSPTQRLIQTRTEFYAELAAGENGFKQICAGLMWTSDFVTAAGELWSCPCYYIAHEVFVHKGAPLDKIATVVNVDQEPFYRVSFGVRPGVAYRGGYALHSDNIHITGDADPMIGNIFAFGQTTARGGPPEALNAGIVRMSVEIVPDAGASPKTGTMKVYGLAFDPHIDARTLIIYYGDGGADDKTKQLYVSAPGSRQTRLDATKLTGGTGIKNDAWVTSIRVTSPNTIVAVAKTEITDAAHGSHLFMSVIAPRAQGLFDGAGEIGTRVALANVKGNVYAPKYTVTQYLAAPVVCSDFRSDCIEPLDQTSPFLPPEMRDFHLTLRDMDWRHVPDLNVIVSRLIFSEFNGGNQQVAAIPSLLSVPEFRVTESSVEGTTFDFQTYTPMGPPAFWAFFARRSDNPNVPNQPTIMSLSIECISTGKKSDTIQDTGIAELYFITQRNVHNLSGYDADAYKARQVILMRSEDVGTMGISPQLFQREKRARFRVRGSLRSTANARTIVYAVMVYNNRGLQIVGKEISVQYL